MISSCQASLSLPYYHVNDVFLTGFARDVCDLEIFDDNKSFQSGESHPRIWTRRKVAFHYISDTNKLILEHIMHKQNGELDLCLGGWYCIDENENLFFCEGGTDIVCKVVQSTLSLL